MKRYFVFYHIIIIENQGCFIDIYKQTSYVLDKLHLIITFIITIKDHMIPELGVTSPGLLFRPSNLSKLKDVEVSQRPAKSDECLHLNNRNQMIVFLSDD